jgi:hypothetical protein
LISKLKNLFRRVTFDHGLVVRNQSVTGKRRMSRSHDPFGIELALQDTTTPGFGVDQRFFDCKVLRFLYVKEINFRAVGIDQPPDFACRFERRFRPIDG